MLFSAEQTFVGRDEKRAPLKTPAWEATGLSAVWCTCPAGYTGAFCQKKGKRKYNKNIILHGIYAVIAWDFGVFMGN